MRRSLCNLVFYLICILFSLSLWGQKRINIEQAEKVAENIASSFTSGKARGSKLKLNLVHISTKSGTNKFKTLTTNDEVYYYVFNVNTNDGFVVVSGNDIAIPVLGYSNEGGYNEKDIPPALAWWMNQYKQEIQYALDHKITQDKETKAKWADFTAGTSQSASPKTGNRSSYTPGINLIKTKWSQWSPYNDLVKSKLGKNYPTGCVATVMAQLMNYWEHPAKTLAPIPGYTTRTLNISVPGIDASTPIDWANMINDYSTSSYTPTQAKAVSELMYYVGVSNQMDYTSSGSGTYVSEKSWINYFGYNGNRIEKSQHSANWDAILKTQIDTFQPMMYIGKDVNRNESHAFICDGYEYRNGSLYFHFNWGWGGQGDDYFTTSALMADSGSINYNFSAFQAIIANIKPAPLCDSNNYEPNETLATAHPIEVNAIYKATIGSTTDQDYYKFTLSDLSNIEVSLQNLPKDYNLKLLNSAGAEIDSSILEGTSNETIRRNILAPGTYYVHVYGNNNSFDNQCYNLKVKATTTSCPSIGTTYSGVTDGVSARVGWLPIDGVQSYTVRYKKSTDSEWITAASETTDNTVTIDELTPNTIYNWEVKSNCTSSISSGYIGASFTTRNEAICISKFEPNNHISNARLIDIDTSYSAGIDNARDQDFYKFILSSRSDIAVTLKNLPKNYDLKLMNSAGIQIGLLGNKTGTNDEIISSNSQPAGTYYIQVYGFNGVFDLTQCYDLKVSTIMCSSPSGLTDIKIADNSVSLNWDPISGYPWYTIEYKTSSATSWIPAIQTTKTSYTLSDLIANTTYDWRIKVYCSEYATASFTTSTVCPVPTGLSTDNVRPNAINLKWNAVSGAQSYTVEYKTATTSWTPVPTPITTGFYDLSGLTANTTYNWRIKANCSGSSSSEYTDGTSSFMIPPACIFAYEDNETFATAKPISLNTNHSAGIDKASDQDYYKFTLSALSDIVVTLQNLPKDYELKLLNSIGTQIGTSTLSGTANEIISLNSQPAGTYYVQVYGVSGAFDLNQCYNLKVATTTVAVCTVPTGLTFADPTTNSINLKWNAVSGAQSYTVEHKTLTSSTWIPASTVSTNSYTLQGLTANTVYNWKVKANCSGSSSSEYTDGTSSFMIPPACIFAYEDNETFATAKPISLNTVHRAAIGSISDMDYYKFTLSVPSDIVITLQKISNNYNLYLYDSLKKQINYSMNSGTADETITMYALAAGTYYVLPFGASGAFDTNQCYELKVAATTAIVCAAPTGLTTSDPTANSVKLNWTAVSGVQNYTIEYKTSATSTWSTPIPVTSTSYTLEGLTANMTYDWQVKANCTIGGSSEYINGTSFKTLTVCTPPTGLAITNITPNSARVWWDMIAGRSYVVEYKPSSATSWKKDTSSTSNSLTLLGLTADTTYDWQVKVNCSSSNSSEYRKGESFKTLSACMDEFEPNETQEAAQLISLNTVYRAGIYKSYDYDYYKFTLSATSDVVITLGNLLKDYQLTLMNSSGIHIAFGTKAGTADKTIIKNALAAGTYSVRVIGYNGAFDASQCYTLKVSTGTSTSCTAPTVLLPASITSSTADLKWNVVSGAQSYTVEYKLSTASWTSATTTTIATTNRSLLGLIADTTYDWRVKTNCSGSSSSGYTYGTSFKTLAATVVCNPPTVLLPANITSSTADLKWNVVSGAQSYTVEYKLSTASWTSATTTTIANTSRSLGSLTADTTYDWRIKANCSGSSSSGYTDGTSFKTLAATVVCNPPTVLPPANITSSTADLKWNVVSGAQSYTVEYKLSTASWTSATPITIATTNRSLLGLTADTTYDWRIKANCSGSSSSGYTYGTSFKTLAATVVCNPGLYEPNNTRKAASLIDLNTTYKAGIQVTLDRDYYKFILSAPSNVVITLENVPENYTFQLLNYLGSYIDSGFMSGNGKTIKRALARGTYYINITAFSRDYDASQCYALRINTPSGSSSPSSNETVVNDKNTILSSNVTLYPNPVDDMINIKGLVSDQEYTQLTIIDRNGGIVKISQVKVEDIIRVDVSDLSPNIYHLTILGKNFRFIKK